MHRRTFLLAASAGVVSPAFAANISPGAALAPSDGQISWEDFVARAQADGQRLVTDRSQTGQDAYLHAIAQHAARLGELPPVEPVDFGDLDPSYSFQMLRYAAPFAVIYWRMAPGGIYPAHNHPATNVCTLCTAGAANVRNFDLGDAPPIDDHERVFEAIETGHDVLEPGVVNFVTEHRNNVHWFEAGPEGAEGLDITTTYGRMQPFSFMRLRELGLEAPGRRRFSAQWVGIEPRRALD